MSIDEAVNIINKLRADDQISDIEYDHALTTIVLAGFTDPFTNLYEAN